jgi:outer membrane murein-binding lipoprotein Lpp
LHYTDSKTIGILIATFSVNYEKFMKRTVSLILLPVILSGFVIVGCDQGQQAAKISPAVVKKYTKATALEGVVSNDKGVIKSGTVEAADESGRLIAHAIVDNGQYSMEIPANTALPILLTFSSESGAEKLVAAVIHESITRYEINPSSTAIAKAAKAMGGYTHANMIRAAENTTHVPDANKTTTGWRGDPTKQYGGWH